jgi:hypothetical protein
VEVIDTEAQFTQRTHMTDAVTRYTIRIRNDLTDEQLKTLRSFATESSDGDPNKIFLRCANIDVSHHYFLKASVLIGSEGPYMDLWIPHQFVMLIGDFSALGSKTPPGFS